MALITFNGCFSPRAVVRVEPDETEAIFWSHGQAIAEQKQEDIWCRAAFSHANQEYLVFDLEVINESEQDVLVTPEQLFLATPTNFQLPALDPERILLAMEVDASRQEANAKNAAVATGVVLVGAAVAAALSDNDNDGDNDTSSEEYYDDEVDAGLVVDAAIPALYLATGFANEPPLSAPVDALPGTADPLFWSDFTLRRTTLRPNERIRGLVAFPRYDDTESFFLHVPIAEQNFRFYFRQRLIFPQ